MKTAEFLWTRERGHRIFDLAEYQSNMSNLDFEVGRGQQIRGFPAPNLPKAGWTCWTLDQGRRMTRRAASFTQADVVRALRAAEQVAAGRMVVEIAPGGIIRIKPAAGDRPRVEADREDEVDKEPKWRL
jgi:hypothetical protein